MASMGGVLTLTYVWGKRLFSDTSCDGVAKRDLDAFCAGIAPEILGSQASYALMQFLQGRCAHWRAVLRMRVLMYDVQEELPLQRNC